MRPRLAPAPRYRGADHQEVEALTEHFFPVVSGQGQKALIGKNERMVGLRCEACQCLALCPDWRAGLENVQPSIEW
jgi:hypothetical protein